MNAAPHDESIFHILIFDDNESTRNLAKATLEKHLNCQARTCSNAGDLFNLSKQAPPDLILLDVDLGAENSLDICHQIRSNPSTESVPIVFLSAYKDPAKRVAALKSGGVDYLDKPFYPEELVTRIRNHIELHRLRLKNLDQIAEQKSLLRVLCHDLVNPIFAAQGLLEIRIQQGKLDTKTATMVLNSCNTALEIIRHTREEHSLVAQDKQHVNKAVHVKDAVEESARTLGNRFTQKDVKLVAEVDPEVKISINRVVLVHNILNNLLTNALKFSYPQSEVRLKSYRIDEARCVVEVSDQGIGMPSAILENIFDENAKVSRVGTGSEKGTGFGMPLVKRYVEKHSGSIEILSKEKRHDFDLESGTTVRLTFPEQN